MIASMQISTVTCQCARCKAKRGEKVEPVLYGLIDLDNPGLVISEDINTIEKILVAALAKDRKTATARITSPDGAAAFARQYFDLIEQFNARNGDGKPRPDAEAQ